MKTLVETIQEGLFNKPLYKKPPHNIFGLTHESRRIMEYKKWIESKYPDYGILVKDAKDILKDENCINLTKENIDEINRGIKRALRSFPKMKRYDLICIYDKSHPEVYAVNIEFSVYVISNNKNKWWGESDYDEKIDKCKNGYWESLGTIDAINALKNYFK